MATSHQDQIQAPDYHNWVRAVLGLQYTREGLESFINMEAEEFHKSLLKKLSQPPQACNLCTLSSLLPHQPNVCLNRQLCICHKYIRNRSMCPNNVCGTLFNAIVDAHIYNGPSWKNSCMSRWVLCHWEVAKNFLPNVGGYCNNSSAKTTDLSGLLNIGINMKDIAARHSIPVDQCHPTSVIPVPVAFFECKEGRNKLLHAASQSLTETEFSHYISIMIAALECAPVLLDDHVAQQAVAKLRQLETSTFVITDEDIDEVRRTVTEARKRATEEIQETGNQQIEALQSEAKKSRSEIDSAVVYIRNEVSLQSKTLREEAQKQLQAIQAASTSFGDASYEEEKIKLRNHLIANYKAQFHSDTLSDIDKLYVQPCMTLKSYGRQEGGDKSLNMEEVFFRQDEKFSRIYVSGDAGHGKTSLCKMLVLAWCQANSGNISKHIPEEFLKTMLKFSFVFYVSLRNTWKQWIVREIIKDSFFQGNPAFMDKFLKNEHGKNLIILDGLDEWEPPVSYVVPMNSTRGLLDFCDLHTYTVFTTTRPWKLEVLRLPSHEIDRYVHLQGIDRIASDEFIKEMINILNRERNLDKNDDVFKRELREKQMIDFRNIPIILKQLIFLWHRDENGIAERSLCQIYSAMIDHLLRDALRRNENSTTRKPMDTVLPTCLESKQYCKIHRHLLFSLAKLAYTATFKSDTAYSLVFDHMDAEVVGLSEDDVKLCLKVGLLSQEIYGNDEADDKKTLSFLHKSFQDFFAAVYLVNNPESAQIPEACYTLEKIQDMEFLFLFVSGMDSKVMTTISQHLKRIKEIDGKTNRFFSVLDMKAWRPIKNFMFKCVKESFDSGQESCPVFQFENVVIDIGLDWEYERVYQHWKWQCLPHLIWTNINNIEYVRINYSGTYAFEAHSEYSTYLQLVSECSLVHNVNLMLGEKLPSEFESPLLEAFRDKWLLTTLGLHRKGCLPFCRYLCSDRVTALVKIELTNISNFNHAEYQNVMVGIGKATHLQNLELARIKCKDHVSIHGQECHCLLDLSQCSKLKKIILDDLSVARVTINPASLTHCEINGLVSHPDINGGIFTMDFSMIRDPPLD